MADEPDRGPRRRYVWPWFVLAALLLGIALAILWMSAAVRRTRESRDPNAFLLPNAANVHNNTSAGMTPEDGAGCARIGLGQAMCLTRSNSGCFI